MTSIGGFASWDGPAGFTARRPETTDIPRIAAFINQCVHATLGLAYVSDDDLRTGWDEGRALLGLLVFDGGDLVAYASPVDENDECYFDLFALPSTTTDVVDAVIRWVEESAMARGRRKISSNIDSLALYDRFMDAGYDVSGEEAAMFLDTAGAPAPVWPSGVAPSPFREGEDELLMFETMRKGFGADFKGEFESWIQRHQNDKRYDPELWFFAKSGDEVLAAVQGKRYWGADEQTGWLHNLATIPSARRKGLGRAMVLEMASRFAARSIPRMILGVSLQNPTEAVAFYEHIGMTRGVPRIYDVEKMLGPTT